MKKAIFFTFLLLIASSAWADYRFNPYTGKLDYYEPSDGQTYPGAGIPLSTGSAWGTSITDNSANWNTAYGWGNHASAGYVTSLNVGGTVPGLTYSNTFSDNATSAQASHILTHNNTTTGFGGWTISNGSAWNDQFGRMLMFGSGQATDFYMSADSVANQSLLLLHSQGCTNGMAIGTYDDVPFRIMQHDRETLKIDSNGYSFKSDGTQIASLSPTGTLKITKDNDYYGLDDASYAHLVLDNPDAFGQNLLIFQMDDTPVGGVRADYQGNFNWHAAGPQGHQFYTGVSIVDTAVAAIGGNGILVRGDKYADGSVTSNSFESTNAAGVSVFDVDIDGNVNGSSFELNGTTAVNQYLTSTSTPEFAGIDSTDYISVSKAPNLTAYSGANNHFQARGLLTSSDDVVFMAYDAENERGILQAYDEVGATGLPLHLQPYGGSLYLGTSSGIVKITSGLVSAGTVAIGDGGTGQTTAQAAIDALTQVSGATNEYVLTKDTATGNAKWKASSAGFSDPMTTRGDIIFRNAANSTTRLGAGTVGQVLTSDGADIGWDDLPAIPDNLTDFTSQTAWRMFYSNTDGDVTELAFGDSGKVLQSNGSSAAPTWETPSGGSGLTQAQVLARTV